MPSSGSGRLIARNGSTWLLALSLVACGGGGGGSEAGPPPTPTPPLLETDRDRAEAATSAALSLIALTTALVTEVPRAAAPAAMQRASRAGAPALADGEADGTRAVRVPCEGGGTLDGSCAENGGVTTVISVTRACRLVDPATGLTVLSDGELTARYSATAICSTGEIPENVPVAYRYREFRATTTDGDEVVETFAAPMLVQRVEPGPAGCLAGDGLTAYDGSLDLSRPGMAFELTFSDFALAVQSSGTPCRRTVGLGGRIEVRDRDLDHAFAAQPVDLEIDLIDGETALASIRGGVTIACLGEVAYGPGSAITPSGRCPSTGGLRIALPGGTDARAEFVAGAVAFDYDSDGRPDASAASCFDGALARCGD